MTLITLRQYDIFLPGNVETPGNNLLNGMIYKFSPDWELLYAKPMVHHTEGIATAWELTNDSVNAHYMLYIQGMSFDEEDNMYVSGSKAHPIRPFLSAIINKQVIISIMELPLQ